MDSVITNPIVDGVLTGDRVAAHQDDPQWEFGFVSFVTPHPVDTARYAETSTSPNEETCDDEGEKFDPLMIPAYIENGDNLINNV